MVPTQAGNEAELAGWQIHWQKGPLRLLLQHATRTTATSQNLRASPRRCVDADSRQSAMDA